MRVLIWHWCHGPCARLALLWSRRAVWLKLLLELEVDSFPNCVFRICCRVLIYGIEHLFFLSEMTKGSVQCPPRYWAIDCGCDRKRVEYGEVFGAIDVASGAFLR